MEKESRLWTLRCLTCRSETSLWDAGGIRYLATGRSWTLRICRTCSRVKQVKWNSAVTEEP